MSSEAPYVLVKTRPSAPSFPEYVLVQAPGTGFLFSSAGESGFMPLSGWAMARTS